MAGSRGTPGGEFTVAKQRHDLILAERGQLLGHIDRAVLPPGQADGHGQVAALVMFETCPLYTY